MKRLSILLFGVVVYAVFFATFLYLVAFVGNLSHAVPALAPLVPHTVDNGGAAAPVGVALAIDVALILVFGLQHSVMARTGFKAWLHRQLPPAAERSVYVLLASLMLMLLFWQWRPIPALLWSATSTTAVALAWTVFAAGFGLVLLSTFLIDHFDLFGLKQVWRQFVDKPQASHAFVTPFVYKLVRHPLYLGFILAFWSGPSMSVGHLLFAGVMTAYILVAIQLEERDLVKQLGHRYAIYREQVPMLVPGLGGRALRTNAPAE
jgi:protein-S-isoprenylcysteine O-methyltransferase Ste14